MKEARVAPDSTEISIKERFDLGLHSARYGFAIWIIAQMGDLGNAQLEINVL